LQILHSTFKIDSSFKTLGSTGIDLLLEQIINKLEDLINTQS